MSLSERLEERKPQPNWCRNCGSSAHTFCNRPTPEWLRRRLKKQAEAIQQFGTHRIADRVIVP